MAKSIESIRKQIRQTQNEIEELRLGRLTRDETLERLERFVDQQAAQFSIENFVGQATRGDQHLRDDAFQVQTRGVPGASEQFGSIAPWLCALVGDQIKERFKNELDRVENDMCSEIPRAEREQALANKLEELDRLEREEERLIVESENKGAPISRRPDCRAEIVLDAA